MAKPSDDAEDDLGAMFQPDTARKLLRKLDASPIGFAFGLDEGAGHLVLHRRKKGKDLSQLLKKNVGCRKLAFGSARTDGQVLILDLEGPALAGLTKKVKLYLKDNKPMPFADVKLLSGGKPVAEPEEGADGPGAPGGTPPPAPPQPKVSAGAPVAAEDKQARLAKFTERFKKLKSVMDQLGNAHPTAADQKKLAGGAIQFAQKGEFDKADQVLDAWKKRLAGAAPGSAAAAGAAATAGLAAWNALRGQAEKQVAAVQAVLRKTGHPLLKNIADHGLENLLKRLRESLGGNLSDRKALLAAIASFRAFLKQDRGLVLLESNPLGVPVNIRSLLGKGLDELEKANAA